MSGASIRMVMYPAVVKALEEKVKATDLKDIAEDILSDAKAAAPVETGTLRASGSVERDGDGYTVGFSAPYAAYVELGTRNMTEQPYLLPAATKKR